MIISKEKFIIIFLNIFVILVSLLILFDSKVHDVRYFSLFGTIITIILFGLLIKIKKKILDPFIMMFFSFCVFQFGQFYMYAFNVKYDYYVFLDKFYSTFCGNASLLNVQKYTILAIELFGFAGIITYNEQKYDKKSDILLNKDNASFMLAAKILFVFSSIPMLIITVAQILVVHQYGYIGIRSGDSSVVISQLNVFNKLSVFFLPMTIFLWIFHNNNRKKQLFYEALIIINAVIYLYIGQRTVSLSLLMVLVLLKQNFSSSLNKKSTIKIAISIFVAVILANFSAIVRNRTNVTINMSDLIFGGIVDFVGGCGWSCFPLMVVMESCPRYIPFSYGKSYLISMLGIIPSFIDPTGTLQKLISTVDENWLTEYVGINFGAGYSLVAESYVNFAWFGLIAIFIIGLLIGLLLNIRTSNRSDFGYYVRYAMLYTLFTLPRRGVFWFFNSIFYYIIVIIVLKKVISCTIMRQKKQI